MIAYRAMVDVPRELVCFVSGLLARHRRVLGTRKRSRALTPFRQALFGLIWFRDRGVDLRQLAAGFGISRATAYRYRDEVITVLAVHAPDLTDALHRVKADGFTHVILDGKIVPTDRYHQKTRSKKGDLIDAWYSGKTRDFGGNIQAVMRPDGFPIWISDVEPGSYHDLRIARIHAFGPLYAIAAHGLPTLADRSYEHAGAGIHAPYQPPPNSKLDINNRTYNRLLRALRCRGERGFALLTQRWRTLQHITASPSKIGAIAQAALVLTHHEHGYLSC